jgi:hypothetical protein
MQEPRSTGYSGTDDINIPLVALTVGLFAVVVVVVIVFLQAFFRNADTREIAAKTRSQEDKSTDLGKLLAMQRAELQVGLNPVRETAGGATGTTSGAARKWMSIDAAMRVVSKDYQEGGVR